MESRSARAVAPNEFRVAGAVGRVGDLGRPFVWSLVTIASAAWLPVLYCAAVYLFVTRF